MTSVRASSLQNPASAIPKGFVKKTAEKWPIKQNLTAVALQWQL